MASNGRSGGRATDDPAAATCGYRPPQSTGNRTAVAGAAVVGVAFGMVRYAFGLTLPDVRRDLEMTDLLLGLVASGTFAGYLGGLLLTGPLAARKGLRAPTTVGGVCGVVGCLLVAIAPSPAVLAGGAVLAGTAAGWVWAPYSDIVEHVAPVHRRPRLLAVINTGTSAGFVMLAVLAVVAMFGSWRLVWLGTAAAASLAAFMNLRFVPRLPVRSTRSGVGPGAVRARSMRQPLAYSVAYSAGCTVFFTYATQAITDGGLPSGAAAVLFVAVAVTGLAALWTHRVVASIGAPRVGALCVGAQGAATALLAFAGGSVSAIMAASLVYGAGYMVGGAMLAIWTAEAWPQGPMEAFTAALIIGAVSSITAPTVIGMLTPAFGLVALLLAAGSAAILTALVMWVLGAGHARTAR